MECLGDIQASRLATSLLVVEDRQTGSDLVEAYLRWKEEPRARQKAFEYRKPLDRWRRRCRCRGDDAGEEIQQTHREK